MIKEAYDSWRYLTISPIDDGWGIVCTTVGYQNVAPRSRYPLSEHPRDYNPISSGRILNEYQLIYILSGTGDFSSASCSNIKVSAGAMIMLFPGEWHTYSPDKETGWSELWVGFKGASADLIVKSGFFTRKDPVHKIGISETIVGLYRDIISNVEQQQTGFQQLIAGIVQHILGLVYYKKQNIFYADNPIADKVNRARILMRENVGKGISAEEISARMGLGYSWFRRIFKEYTGTTPAQYQLQLRLAKAKELLASSEMSLSEIAYELGFESISQFSTFFKKREGVTASEFRGKNSLNYRKNLNGKI